MRKIFRKFSIAAACTLLAATAASMAGCGYSFKPLDGAPAADAEVVSQGGFVVQKGDYVYFINGVETYTSDNTYGTPVKGALMRAKMSDIKAGVNAPETVVPSLMVAADYTSGLYIYGDRIYYATPNNTGNTAGQVDNTYLDFRTARLDGSDERLLFRVADNATLYRFVEADGTVYVVYEESDDIISYNTSSEESVTLAESVTSYAFNSEDLSDPYVYYTMDVTDRMDSANPQSYEYNQIYRVRADETEGAYEYTWDQEYLDREHEGEAPYTNLGEIVLDGISINDDVTQFNPDAAEGDGRTVRRYEYTLQAYTNGGIYFLRTSVPAPGSSVGTEGVLYYLSADKLTDGWDSISGNSVCTTENAGGALEVVAASVDTDDADSAAYFYIEEGEGNVKHHYLFVNDAGEIRRVDVVNDGLGTKAPIGRNGESSLRIAKGASGAVLTHLDSDSSETYDYVYYTCSTENGLSIERAVYNGEPEYYASLTPAGADYTAYQPVRVLEAEHASGWYNYEVLDGVVFYVNAETFSSTAYTYVWTIDLNGENGLMDNAQIKAFNERYENIVGDEGYLEKLADDGNNKLSYAIRYFFYTGESEQFAENIAEAESFGKRSTYLYTEEEQEAFNAFVGGTSEDAVAFFGENYLDEVRLSNFTNFLGVRTEADEESLASYWQNYLERYTEETVESEGIPAWGWALIGVAIGVVVLGAALAIVLILRKKSQAGEEKPELMEVDTTDDTDVDVYANNDSAPAVPAVPAEEAPVEEAPAEETPAEEAPAEIPAEEAPVEETPVEAPAEEAPAEVPAGEAPAEDPVPPAAQ